MDVRALGALNTINTTTVTFHFMYKSTDTLVAATTVWRSAQNPSSGQKAYWRTTVVSYYVSQS